MKREKVVDQSLRDERENYGGKIKNVWLNYAVKIMRERETKEKCFPLIFGWKCFQLGCKTILHSSFPF